MLIKCSPIEESALGEFFLSQLVHMYGRFMAQRMIRRTNTHLKTALHVQMLSWQADPFYVPSASRVWQNAENDRKQMYVSLWHCSFMDRTSKNGQ